MSAIGIQPVHPAWDRIISRHTTIVTGKSTPSASLYDTSWSKIMRIHTAMQVQASTQAEGKVSTARASDTVSAGLDATPLEAAPDAATATWSVALASEMALEAIESTVDDKAHDEWSDCDTDSTDAVFDSSWDRIMTRRTPAMLPKLAPDEPSSLELPKQMCGAQREAYHEGMFHDYDLTNTAQAPGPSWLQAQWLRIFSVLLAVCDLTRDNDGQRHQCISRQSAVSLTLSSDAEHRTRNVLDRVCASAGASVDGIQEGRGEGEGLQAWQALKVLYSRLPWLALVVCSLLKKAQLQGCEQDGMGVPAHSSHTVMWILIACFAMNISSQSEEKMSRKQTKNE